MSDEEESQDFDDLEERLRQHVPNYDSMTEEEKGQWALNVLDKLPPEEARQMILERGTLDLAANLLQEWAASDDPKVRAEALSIIQEYDLELLLVGEADETKFSDELGAQD
jgi:hypothetical protein